MKISLIKKIILNNKLLILLFVILISCDSAGDSGSGDMENINPGDLPTETSTPVLPTNTPLPSPAAPTMTPDPTPQPTEAPPTPTPQPTEAPPTSTPQPTEAPPTPTPQPTNAPVPPPDQPLNEFQSLVLDLVNDARAQSRNCGGTFFPAAPAVNWDERIESAALKHSQDMAQNENFSHTGTDGSNAGDRLLVESYNWNTWGENILVGLDAATGAIDAWIGSPGHCSIIMNPSFKEVGAGVDQGLFQGGTASYWTLLFATEN